MSSVTPPPPTDAASTPRIVRWPCDGVPYRDTVRSRYFARVPESYRVGTAYILLALLVAALGAPSEVASKPGVATPLVAWVLFALIAWSVGVLLRNRVMRFVWEVLRGDPDQATQDWRDEWKRLEAASNDLKSTLRHSSRSLTPETAWESSPRFPQVTRLLIEPSSAKNQRPARAASTAFAAVVTGQPPTIELVRGRILLALASVGGFSVVGRAGDRIIATFMAAQNIPTQFWVIVSATPTGSAFSISIESGLMWWAESGTRRDDGAALVGDVRLYRMPVLLRHIRRSPLTLLGLTFCAVIMVLAWPLTVPAALLAYVALVLYSWRRPAEELELRTGTHPGGGESLDLALLTLDRIRGDLEAIRPSDQVLDQVKTLAQEVMTKVHAAATISYGRTHAMSEED